MHLIDSHCHLDLLDLSKFENSTLETILENAHNAKICHILCVAVNLDHIPSILQIANQFKYISTSVGLHPNEKIPEEPSIETLISLASHNKVIAIGETGLDYYYSDYNQLLQELRFRKHIEVAKKLSKPLIVHTRNARENTLAILKEENAAEVGGILHCFTENWEMAKAALEENFYISFSGIITFPKAENIQEVAKRLPLDRILIETDAPYLTPVPHRGKPNQPAYVHHVAEYLATLRNLPLEVIAHHTTENFKRLFPSVECLDFN